MNMSDEEFAKHVQVIDARLLKALGIEESGSGIDLRSQAVINQAQIWALARYVLALEDRIKELEAKHGSE